MLGHSRTYSFLKDSCLIVVVCIIMVCLFEFSGRIVLSIMYESSRYMLYGFIPQPKFQTIKAVPPYVDYYKGTPSRSSSNPVNTLGLRGFEIGAKKHGTLRIVCLGASTTYGDNLDYRDTYPALLQEQLNSAYGTGRYEVVNAGQPGFDLNHILSFTKHEGLELKPDIVLVLSINNNFKAPGFWFVQVDRKDQKKQPDADLHKGILGLARLKQTFMAYSAVGKLAELLLYKRLYDYFADFDWEGFARALMAEDNIWESEYRRNLQSLIDLITSADSKTEIILLEQAVNTVQYPCLAAPWEKAGSIFREMAALNAAVHVLDIRTPVVREAMAGVSVWQDRTLRDPLHLSRAGNAIVAETITAALPGIMAGR